MNIFKIKSNTFLGIDFGTSAIKAVELSFKNQRTHLINYGWVDFNKNQSSKFKSREEKLKVYLAELLKKMETKNKAVYVSMPGFSGLVALVEFSDVDDKELDDAIKFEAQKYIPTSLDDVYLSWDVVSRDESEEKNMFVASKNEENKKKSSKIQVLLVAAPKDDVAKYEKLVEGAGLKMNSLELEMFSMARSLVGDDLGNFLIIDIGAKATNIVLVEKGTVKANRVIDTGGDEISETISSSMNISLVRAEEFKKQKNNLLEGKNSGVILPTLDLIANEALRIVTTYRKKNGDLKIDGAILSGGMAKMSGMPDYFSKSLGTNVVMGNPWKKVNFDKKLDLKIKEMGTSFSVAVGLAMKGVGDYQRKN